ncbi:MAG: AAA family ATPase [Actinomycetota bacterium]|jgi:MinD-like ATPase involved in chromosome partitioning or flagellar assembly|nr:AAA family ATPase [Actinomycetota bacterium]
MNSQSILVTGAKGGCGTSFIGYSLAAYYAVKKEVNVLLLDLDYGSASSRVVFDIQDSKHKHWGYLKGKPEDIDITLLKNLVINTEYSLNLILPPLDIKEDAILNLGQLLASLKQYFQIIVIDMPSCQLNLYGDLWLEQVERIIAVSSPTLISVKNLNHMISSIQEVKGNPDIEVVINRYNQKPSLSPTLINSYLNYPINSFIPYDRDIEHLFLNQGPAPMFKYNLRITTSIISLADCLYEELEYV